MKTILITGVAGLLGNNLLRYLLNKNYNIIGIDSLFGGYKEFLPESDRFKFYEIDLMDNKMVSNIFDDNKIDVVFHLAAYAAEGLSPFIRRFNYENNVICSVNIINECVKHDCKLIFTSSMAVYGNQKSPFIEEMLPIPVDPYGIAKYAVEMDIKLANEQFGLRYNIVRPHNVLGIYQNIWDKYRNVIGIFIRNVLNNESILIYGDGEQTRAFSDIKYYLEPFEKLIDEYDSEIINIGADKYFTINEVANKVSEISKKYGYNSTIKYVEPRHEVKHAYCNHDKAKKLLNFNDATNIDELIETMFIWYKDIPNKDVKKINYEIEKNIYSYWKVN
jgi:UDP-glucose 4-epimerase